MKRRPLAIKTILESLVKDMAGETLDVVPNETFGQKDL